MGSEGVLRRVQWLNINQQIARVARLVAARKDEVDGPSDTWLRGWVRGYIQYGGAGAGKLVRPLRYLPRLSFDIRRTAEGGIARVYQLARTPTPTR